MIDQNTPADESGATIPAQAIPEEQAQPTCAEGTAEAASPAQEPTPKVSAHDVGRGLINPIMHMAVDGKLVDVTQPDSVGESSQTPPGVQVSVTNTVDVTKLPITQAMGRLIDLLTAAGHPEPDTWTLSVENPANVVTLDTHQTIFLVNRALRLLLAERRDIPVDERTQALLGIVNIDNIDRWLQTLEKATVPVMVKYNVGRPGFIKADELARAREAEEIIAPEEKV